MAQWGVETVERQHGVVGTGEWSAGAMQWGVETVERRRSTVGSGVRVQHDGERRHGVMGSGDDGVQRDSMGSGVRALVILYTPRGDFEPLDPCELTSMMNQA
jgi:hypothetical protein